MTDAQKLEALVRKDVIGYPGYYACDNGLIMSTKYHTPRFMAGTRSKSGRHTVRLWDASGNSKMFYVHRLIATAFIGTPPTARHEVNHKDGNPSNNIPSNLEWCTKQENIRHAWLTGLMHPVRGELVGSSKLTNLEAANIRSRLLAGESIGKLSKELGLSLTILKNLRRGKTYA
jgi:HNH endonuclease